MLNKRLEALASFIDEDSSCLDVGCDHGLLDIYLFKNRKNIRLVASDINKKPLEKAKDNFLKYHVNDIELRLGNGLDVIDSTIDTVIISGMGGLTICDILKKEKLANVKKIVLSPNKDFYEVRKKVMELGYSIEKEQIVKENNKYYLILSCQKKDSNYQEDELRYGTISMIKDEVYKDYLNYLIIKYTNRLDKIPNKYQKEIDELKKEIIKIKNFL